MCVALQHLQAQNESQEKEIKMQRDYVSQSVSWPGGPTTQKKQDVWVDTCVCVCCCSGSSESEGIDHAHDHYVPDRGDDGDPEPDGVAGHGLRLVLLALGGGRWGDGVDAGRGVEERMLAAVVVVGGGVHEGPRHHGDLRSNELDN